MYKPHVRKRSLATGDRRAASQHGSLPQHLAAQLPFEISRARAVRLRRLHLLLTEIATTRALKPLSEARSFWPSRRVSNQLFSFSTSFMFELSVQRNNYINSWFQLSVFIFYVEGVETRFRWFRIAHTFFLWLRMKATLVK